MIQLAKAVCSSVPMMNSRNDSFGMPPPPNRMQSNPCVYQSAMPETIKDSYMTPQRHKISNNKNFEPARLTRSLSDAITKQPSLRGTDDMSLIADDDENDACVRIDKEATNRLSTNEVRNPLSASLQQEIQVTNLATLTSRETLEANVHTQRKSKPKLGPLGKRLKCLRDSIKGDCLRFQSGQYPFTDKSKNNGAFSRDGGDPRSRASNHCDVTIISPVMPFEAENDGEVVAALAYVHCFKYNELKIPVLEHSRTNTANQKGFVWMLFSRKTVIEQKLAVQSELRIYNSVWIPASNVAAVSYLKTTGINSTIKWLVACTQLCEPYPSLLQPLPSLNDLTDLDLNSKQSS
jgi:hypothetical protein